MDGTFTLGTVDRLLGKPFVWIIRAWVRTTGRSHWELGRLAAVVGAVVMGFGDVLLHFDWLIPFSLAIGAMRLFNLRRYEKRFDMNPERISLDSIRLLREMRLNRMIILFIIIVSISAPILDIGWVLFLLCDYCCTTTSTPGKRISERIRDAVSRLPQLTPSPSFA